MLYANITNKTVSLRFRLKYDLTNKGEYSYNLGDELFKFLSFDLNEVYSLYQKTADTFMARYYGSKDKTEYNEKITALSDEIDKHCIYLHLYTIDFLESMTDLQMGREYAMDSYVIGRTVEMQDIFYRHEILAADKTVKPYFDIDFLDHYTFDMTNFNPDAKSDRAERQLYKEKSRNLNTKSVSKAVMQRAIGMAVLFLAEDLKRKRNKFVGDIKAITEGDDNLDGLSLTQKLCLLDMRRNEKWENDVYSSELWKTAFVSYPRIPHDLEKENDVKKFIIQNNVEIKQVHEIPSAESLIVFELLNLLTSDSLIKKCRYCGNYFTPHGRIDTEYCDRIAKGEIKPCNEIGAMKLHQAAKAESPVHLAYQKAYRRMNAKARTRRITQTEFLAWSDEARVKRDACLSGRLAFEAFAQWLDGDKKK